MSIGHIGENVLQQREIDNEYRYEEAYQAEGAKMKRATRQSHSSSSSARAPSVTPDSSNWRASLIILTGFGLLTLAEYIILFGREWWHFLVGGLIFFIAFILLASQIEIVEEKEVKTMKVEKSKIARVLLVFVALSVTLFACSLGIRPYNVCYQNGEQIHIEYSFFDIIFLVILMILEIIALILILKFEKTEKEKEVKK